ncbi:zeta toxin family protein [Neorhizobium sp. DT-125]|uniref:zeta toxin family protein n=1 Tax=Neorhizobium sp. DT-125 TaxID=3396163 RepID=UPI003F1AA3C5
MPPNNLVRPECTVLAGPNGAGKSSFFKHLSFPGKFINADDVAGELNPRDPEAASLQAGRLVLKTIENVFSRRVDFTYETTLSSHQSINLLKRAKEEGYRTLLIFIALNSADLHVARVQQRVQQGGHNIPEPIIRRRYDLAFENLKKAFLFCEAIVIYDNSSSDGYRELLEIEDGRIVANGLNSHERFDRRIASCVAAGLNTPLESVLSAGI